MMQIEKYVEFYKKREDMIKRDKYIAKPAERNVLVRGDITPLNHLGKL